MEVGVKGVTSAQALFQAALSSENCCGNDCRVPWSAYLPTYRHLPTYLPHLPTSTHLPTYLPRPTYLDLPTTYPPAYLLSTGG